MSRTLKGSIRREEGSVGWPGSSPRPQALVAEDDALMRELVERILLAAGFEVSTATDGQDACDQIDSSSFDVVVTDLEMPRIDGLGLIEHLRHEYSDLPVIVITGSATIQSAMEAVRGSVAVFIEKPFEPADLVHAVESVFRSSGRHPIAARILDKKGDAFDEAVRGLQMDYQPIIRWSTRSTYSHEAFVRSTSDRARDPNRFFDWAESLGKVWSLGREIRAQVATRLVAANNRARFIFVNLHPDELLDDELYDPSSPLSQVASRVVLELTERETLSGLVDALVRVERLKKLGYRIAIGDIGSGYSGLNSFVEFEPNFVKMNMQLVRGIHASQEQQTLVRSQIVLARELAIEVIAEGVETTAERDTLVGIGCDLLQGYLLARPNGDYTFSEPTHLD